MANNEPASDRENTGSSSNPGEEPKEDKPREDPWRARHKRIVRVSVITALALIALVAALLWWLHRRHFESTDDAFVDAHITQLSPRVSGAVDKVLVDDNLPVRAGQLLVHIDPSDILAQLQQARASRESARSQIEQASAQAAAQRSALNEAYASLIGPRADALSAEQNYQRYASLKHNNPAAVAQQQVDDAFARKRSSAGALLAARKRIDSANAQVQASLAQINTAQAQLAAADAQIAQASLSLDYTRIVAPVEGHVSNRTVAVGNYVTPGQLLLAIVPTRVWVTANYKETQLTDMRPGQEVEVDIDAFPHVSFHGHVDSIQRGSGQVFALLPPQNATGNYVKVVQRIPVKIVLDPYDDARYPLGPGMSVVPRVRVR